ncbi:kinesin-like protein KIN-7E isoform X1 [Nicotiana tabacum]|uniref:Kinesin-like protein NACK2 n=4 Tax=Nicotiana TaxID=4085 RepID=A0A1S3ZLX3_TOBAC|nr:PREDICTED: kinesin-like protein NACK2 isoform X1 [Nicotiana sylvestris]XP_009767347.1 PREDICTED: kinesin-like protein NACK2 isoform X1 [Nicotiana sylvestris]XP_016465357.1 PREDICTED: kinesin-like protein NACK2 [Nicotiana tabacum]XP_016465358.1 PREDICTED: kinesin-like protein NACK2 [Nicotiana tabacum]
MSSVYGEEASQCGDDQGSGAHEEKIFVAVRLRPLNEREIANNDVSDWECINNTTILYKNALSERSLFPTACAYDRVFSSECSTRQVYEEAAKGVALSVLSGFNSSIFAYGQTSSGKTYTMSGITEYTLADIYDHTSKNDDREFTLKFSAMEIYNEVVRDLLTPDDTPLRLLDDPERGTVVEKLTEVTLKDWNHLKELLSVCEAQRKIGETALNEMSSRSHQILRLTVESTAKKFVGFQNSSTLTSAVNFVDLAGSERASQTLSANVRLKEGSHINRSLLTLGTVIRKLSKKGNGHIPFRDSKLTRILQNSLGGNARTAIICTMSPAHSHVEQSRNTLLFATCAKNVITNAKVNVVMSEKALVKQLRKELARLEAELRNLSALAASGGSAEALKEKEALIEKMSREIRELTEQRDLAQSRVNMTSSGSWTELSSVSSPDKVQWMDDYAASEVSECVYPFRPDGYEGLNNSNKLSEQIPDPPEDQFLCDDTSPRLFIEKYFGPDPCKGWENIAQRTVPNLEDNCKEVQCVEVDSNTNNTSSDKHTSPRKGDQESGSIDIDHNLAGEQSSSSDTDSSDSNNLPRSRSSEAIIVNVPVVKGSELAKENGGILSESEKELCTIKNDLEEKPSQPEVAADSVKVLSKEQNHCFTIEVKLKMKGDDSEKISAEELKKSGEDIEKICTEAEVAKSVPEKQSGDNLVQDNEPISKELGNFIGDSVNSENESELSPSRQSTEFEKQRQEIIELWDACNVPLVHRTYFFLLFKGDPTDSVYMEVELRRLTYLKNAFSLGAKVVKDGQIFSQAASLNALNREREMLSKLLLKKFHSKERDNLYQKWGIDLKTKKRRLQLCHKLWKDTKDMDHIKESAALISKLVGFEAQNEVPKEMFELNFSPGPKNLRSFSWKPRKPM